MDGAYQLVVGGVNNNGQFAQNVFTFQVSGSSTADEYTTAAALNAAFNTTIIPLLAACMTSDSTLNILYSKRVDGTGGAAIFTSILQNGTDAGQACSNVVACNIAFFPGGAKNRPGHLYTWGVSALHVVEDVILTALRTALTNLANGLLTPLTLIGGGTASYGTWTKKTKTVTTAAHYNVKPKITGMNKRTLPLY